MVQADTKAAILRIAALGPETFTLGTVSNALQLLDYLAGKCADPMVDRGYWPTIRFLWPNAEIEVFDGQLELSRLNTIPLDARSYEQRAGEAFDAALVAELETFVSELPA